MLLQPLVFLLQPPKPAPVVPRAPASHGRLRCGSGHTAPYYSHRWPGHPSTHPHPLLFCSDGSLTPQRTSEPSYSSTCGHPLLRLPRLRVVPFLGLAVVHRRGALRTAWSTWSRNDFHRKSTVRGEADSWVHDHSPFFCDLPSKSLCQACWAANLSRRGELSFGWPRKWPISNEKWVVHF